jgi:rifamycin polyketide synthase module 7/8
MTGHLGGAELSRLNRGGMATIATDEALELFDRTGRYSTSLLVPAKLDVSGWPAQTPVPALLRALVRAGARRTAHTTAGVSSEVSLAQQLAAQPAGEQHRRLLELVREHIAAVLGHHGTGEVEPGRALRDMGFDSLTAVELRNRLATTTGLRLPATLAFDYPTPTRLVEYLKIELLRALAPTPAVVLAELDKIESLFALLAPEPDARTRIASRLQEIFANFGGDDGQAGRSSTARKIDSASDDEILKFIDSELGKS